MREAPASCRKQLKSPLCKRKKMTQQDRRVTDLALRHRRSAALTATGQAAPIQAWAKRGGQAIPARRLGHDQPEAKENGDQRHAEQQPQVHFKPLLFARDIAETAGIGVSRSFQ
jgi:hypothetical protein